MNNSPWAKILLFSLLFGVLGFILGFMCRMHGHDGGFCREAGICRMAGCEHGSMACCQGEGHTMAAACCHGNGGEGHGDERTDAIIEKIKASGFQGDTTIVIEGGSVNIHKENDRMEVKVEMSDPPAGSREREEKVIEKEEKQERP